MHNILAIGAHPDDIELGCAGSLLKFKEIGCNVIYAIMTNGENWNMKKEDIRIIEQQNACNELGVDKIYWMKLKDGSLKVDTKIIDEIEKIILENDIDIVFSNYKNDTHQDHMELFKIVESATRFCPNVFYYEGLSSKGFEPNIFFDISIYIERKKNIINKFESQVTKYNNRNFNLIELIECKNRINGIKLSQKYAEGFKVGKANFDKLFLRSDITDYKTKTFV